MTEREERDFEVARVVFERALDELYNVRRQCSKGEEVELVNKCIDRVMECAGIMLNETWRR